MYLFDQTYLSPEENLACDDVLLDEVEAGRLGPVLRFWEPSQFFVVLGHGNPYLTEVNHDTCKRDAVPIIRRQSGGGTILQGKGVLNYALILPITYHKDLIGIQTTNTYIMAKISHSLQSIIPNNSVKGITDIVLDNKKIMGNAQRRKRKALLFHGSILVNLDIESISRYLAHPGIEPDYRKHRKHTDFLAHTPASSQQIKRSIREHWMATRILNIDLSDKITHKTSLFHTQNEWNKKF